MTSFKSQFKGNATLSQKGEWIADISCTIDFRNPDNVTFSPRILQGSLPETEDRTYELTLSDGRTGDVFITHSNIGAHGSTYLFAVSSSTQFTNPSPPSAE